MLSDERRIRSRNIGNHATVGDPRNRGCSYGLSCLPPLLKADFGSIVGPLMEHREPVPRGARIFVENQHLDHLYAIRAGSIKEYIVTPSGEMDVIGFYFPGDIVGMSAIVGSRYPVTAETLETTALCALRFEQLESTAHFSSGLQHRLYQMLSRELVFEQQLLEVLKLSSAERRVAAFLLLISAKFARRKLSRSDFTLPMARGDIGSYLGLTVETVSRIFSRFQRLGLIVTDNREVRILDYRQLEEQCPVSFLD